MINAEYEGEKGGEERKRLCVNFLGEKEKGRTEARITTAPMAWRKERRVEYLGLQARRHEEGKVSHV